MEAARLPTQLWVRAYVRRCDLAATPAVVARRGDADRGALLLRVNLSDGGCRLLNQSYDIDNRVVWTAALAGRIVDAGEADAYVARAVERDCDLWIIEIDSRDGALPFDADDW